MTGPSHPENKPSVPETELSIPENDPGIRDEQIYKYAEELQELYKVEQKERKALAEEKLVLEYQPPRTLIPQPALSGAA